MDTWIAGILLVGAAVVLAVWMLGVFGTAGGTRTLAAVVLFGVALLVVVGFAVGAQERP